MTYTSPFKLLPSIKLEGDQINYTLLRRRLLAEFELNDDQPLEINGNSIGKTEALSIIEGLKDQAILEQHIEVYQNKELLDFLERKNADFVFNHSNFDKSLPEIIQEDFIDAIDFYIKELYSKNEYERLKKLMSYPLETNVTISVDNPLYHRFYKLVKSDLLVMYEIDESRIIGTKKQQVLDNREIFSLDRAKCIRLLPDAFSNLKEELAATIINISSDLFNRLQERKYAGKMCMFIVEINPSEEFKSIAESNYDIIGKEFSVGRILRYIVPFIFVLVTIYNCSKNNDFEARSIRITHDIKIVSENLETVFLELAANDSITDNVYDTIYSERIANSLDFDRDFFMDPLTVINRYDKAVLLGVFNKSTRYTSGNDMLNKLPGHGWYLVQPDSVIEVYGYPDFSNFIVVKGNDWKKSSEGTLSALNKTYRVRYTKSKSDGYFDEFISLDVLNLKSDIDTLWLE